MRIGKRHGGDRSFLPVQLGRDVRMGQRMAEAGGDRALIVAPLAHADAGRCPADRAPAVGAGHQARGDVRSPSLKLSTALLAVERDAR